jgi:hypothetical protein
MSVTIMNLVAPKAGSKHEHLCNKLEVRNTTQCDQIHVCDNYELGRT